MASSGWLEHASLRITGRKVQAATGLELEATTCFSYLSMSFLAGFLRLKNKSCDVKHACEASICDLPIPCMIDGE
jgi:hypothetical protein